MAFAIKNRDALLDRFPVNEVELDTILNIYKGAGTGNIGSFTTVIANANDSNGDTSQARRQQHDLLVELERSLLPEISSLFESSIEKVFLIDDGEDKSVSLFLEASVSLLGRRGSRFLLQTLFDSAVLPEEGGEELADKSKLLGLIYRLSLASYHLVQNDSSSSGSSSGNSGIGESSNAATPEAWMTSLGGQEETSVVSRQVWNEWATRTAPAVYQVLSTVFHYFLLGPGIPCRPKPFFYFPQVFSLPTKSAPSAPIPEQALWGNCYDSIPAALALMSLGGPWRKLYCSDHDGLSFRTMQKALIGYHGSTIMLIQTTAGDVLGYYTETPWKNSPNWTTGDDGGDAFLFRVHPNWNLYSFGSGRSRKYHQFLHTPFSQRKQILAGLAVGGVAADSPRLHITVSLEGCKACSFDTVFEQGPLLSDLSQSYFDVDRLQVWALRFDSESCFQKGLESGQLKVAIHDATRKNASKVDRMQFVDDFVSGAFINHVFDHRAQSAERFEFNRQSANGESHFVVDGTTRNHSEGGS